jgi:ribosome-associated toxin RatA of RatAB toxin-antitoxin module
MSVKIERSVVLGSPVDDVWAFMDNLDNYPVFTPGLAEMRETTPGPRQIGSQIVWIYHFLGQQFEVTLEVTEYQPPNRFGANISAGPIQMRGTWDYAPLDARATTLRCTLEGETAGVFKLADPLVARAMERQMAASYGTLKDLLEARVKA